MESIEEIYQKAVALKNGSRSLLIFTLLTAILSGMAGEGRAQTFAEWFKQGSTQKKYLLQQIAALQVFSSYLRQGYRVAHQGLGSISNSLTSEHGLHADYYNSLKVANPAVRYSPQVKEILQWQADILTAFSALTRLASLSPDEQSYLASVQAAVLKDCDKEISTLQSMLSDGKLQMSDADRLALLNKIHSGMADNYRFSIRFTNQARLFAAQRMREQADIVNSKKLHGIN